MYVDAPGLSVDGRGALQPLLAAKVKGRATNRVVSVVDLMMERRRSEKRCILVWYSRYIYCAYVPEAV